MADLRHAVERVPVSAAQLAGWRGTRTGSELRLSGFCPACRHHTDARVSLSRTGLESLDDTPVRTTLTVSLTCDCQAAHPGRPAAFEPAGCGRAWTAVTSVTGDAVALSPSDDPHRDAAADALRQARAGQVDRLRTAAEKWIGGISALLGLLTVAGLGLGAEQIRKLGTPGRIAVAVAVAAALALAALAIARAYRAAYGWPVERPVSDDAELLAWYSAQQDLPKRAATRLRGAVLAAGAALAALVVAAGLTWFLPVAKPPAPLVKVTGTDDAVVCGTLLSSTADGQVRLRRADDGAIAMLTAGQVRRVAPVARC